MDEQELKIDKSLREFAKGLPKFPDGRINYHDADKAMVLVCFVKYHDRILLLKRSDKVWTYRGKWNSVAGYMDDFKPLRKKALEEINEEIGVQEKDVLRVAIGEPFTYVDEDIKKTWIVHPLIAELKILPKIKLDFEHTEYKWILPKELNNFDIVPNAAESLKRVISL